MQITFRSSTGECYAHLNKTERGWLERSLAICQQLAKLDAAEGPVAGAAAEGLKALIAKLPRKGEADGN